MKKIIFLILVLILTLDTKAQLHELGMSYQITIGNYPKLKTNFGSPAGDMVSFNPSFIYNYHLTRKSYIHSNFNFFSTWEDICDKENNNYYSLGSKYFASKFSPISPFNNFL